MVRSKGVTRSWYPKILGVYTLQAGNHPVYKMFQAQNSTIGGKGREGRDMETLVISLQKRSQDACVRIKTL